MNANSTAKLTGLGLTALRSNFKRLDRPYKLTFSITYGCQSRCLTCNIWQIKPTGELDLREISEFASRNDHFKWIEITGGEPFLRADMVDIVRAFKESSKGLYILTMPTNSLCNQDMVIGKVRQILELGIPKVSITISLDGYRELHDKIRGIPGNFDRAMGMARRLREMQKTHNNLFFIFGYTMSKFNQGSLMETIAKVREELPWVTANNFHVNVGQLSDTYYKNESLDLRPDSSAISSELGEFMRQRRFEFGAIPIVESAFLKKLGYYVRTGKPPMKGRSLDASLFMDSYGNVYPSIMWGRKIGNIRDSSYSLKPMWNNAEAQEVRKLIDRGMEPVAWTACEAYQTLVGSLGSLFL